MTDILEILGLVAEGIVTLFIYGILVVLVMEFAYFIIFGIKVGIYELKEWRLNRMILSQVGDFTVRRIKEGEFRVRVGPTDWVLNTKDFNDLAQAMEIAKKKNEEMRCVL